MKHSIIVVSLLILLCKPATAADPDTILLFHPTVSNIETIDYLLKNDILNLGSSFHFLGIAHRAGEYDYEESRRFLNENAELPFSLRIIESKIAEADIFKENSWTDTLQEIFTNSVAAIFLGGPDLPPSLYKENTNLLTVVTDPWRHYLEISAIFHFLGSDRNPGHTAFLKQRKNYAVLGICLGMQSLNVGTGGSLVQDIPTELYSIYDRESLLEQPDIGHRNYSFDFDRKDIQLTGYHFHTINFEKNKKLSKKLNLKENKYPIVLSAHHQGIETTGSGIIPMAWSMDGKVIEMIGHEQYHSVVGVQFHPEKTGLYCETMNYYVNPDSLINFNTSLHESSSYDFHLAFWKYISELIKNSQ